jgi:glycosyltransferase involved in cell wall biosynthesis
MDAAMSVALESVDVVIPVYNSANFIEKAIESVMAQTNVIIGKLIVVNDGSSDKTEAVIRAINLPNLELITTPNRGVSTARNIGIAAANSEWIAFLDADDCWDSGKLENQLAIAKQQNVSFVCSATEPNCKKPEGRISFLSLWKGNFIATSSVLMKRELAQEIKPLFSTSMTFAEDYATWFKTLSICSGYFTPKYLTQYVISPKPHYRLGNIFKNFILLQKECILFLLRKNLSLNTRIGGLVVLFSGTTISMLSILKRFMSAYIQNHRSSGVN